MTTIFKDNPALYLKRRILIVPTKDSRVFYCREFDYAPMWVHYEEYDQFCHAQIPYHIRAKLFVPNLYLALLVPGRKLFLFDRDMKPVKVYNSYSGELCFSSFDLGEPRSLEEVVGILDTAAEDLKTIHEDDVVSKAPKGLIAFEKILKAVKER